MRDRHDHRPGRRRDAGSPVPLARRDDLTVGYMISRGLAKAGARQPEDEDNS